MAEPDRRLAEANRLLPMARAAARAAHTFPNRWRTILSHLDLLPPCLASLSSHPFFSKNSLCEEQLLSLTKTLEQILSLPSLNHGKLQTQNELDTIASNLEMAIKDCNLLVKTEVLVNVQNPESEEIQEILARLQLGHAEAKHRALDSLLETLKEDLNGVVSALSRRGVGAVVQFLSAGSAKVREKAAGAVCCLAESGGNSLRLLLSEGAVPPLVRLAETGTKYSKEKAVFSLQRLSSSSEGAREIVFNGGVGTLVAAEAAAALRNLSAVAELRQNLADDGAVAAMVNLLGKDTAAAEFMENVTAGNDSLRRDVIASGGLTGLLGCLEGPVPTESAAVAVRNLVGCVPTEELLTIGLLPRLAHVINVGSGRAKAAAARAAWKISARADMKRVMGEAGLVMALVGALAAKDGAREAAAEALAALMSWPGNAAEMKKNSAETVPRLVHLLDPVVGDSARKHAVSCLLVLVPSRRCRRIMVSNGAVGYLKKLSEMDVPGSKKLLARLQRNRLRSFFSGK